MKLLLTVPTVDPNQQTGSGYSALRGVVAEGHVDAVNVLLANEKVDPNMPSGGITALAVAANHGQNGIMRSLIASGVEPDVKDIGGKTPLMIAVHKGNVEAVGILLSTGRVVADSDLTMLGVSFSCESRLNEAIVMLLDKYNRRGRGASESNMKTCWISFISRRIKQSPGLHRMNKYRPLIIHVNSSVYRYFKRQGTSQDEGKERTSNDPFHINRIHQR